MPRAKPQPKPKAKPKRKRGRPEGGGYHPTEEQRRLVTVMAGMGIPEREMVAAVLNPQTSKAIDPVTLRRHFRAELNEGFVRANAAVGAGLFKNATTPTDVYPGGIPSSQFFWLKCRARWQQRPELNPPPQVPVSAGLVAMGDVGRRLAFVLAVADNEAAKKSAPKQITHKGAKKVREKA